MKKAVIYARFSCSSQNEQSIEGQLRICKEFAKKNDIYILNEYIDRARSGTNDARPAFQKMIKDSSKKQWDYVIVYKLDRFSRDKYDSANYKRVLKNNGTKVVSATENIPDTPEAIIFESVLEGFAQYYSAELSQKVKRGMRESYLKGNFTGGVIPYGYTVKDKKVYIDAFEASIVKEIYDKYANGYTVDTITAELNKRGIKNHQNKPFNKRSLYRILISTKYNGRVTYNGIEYSDIFPKIIDDVMWFAINNKHKEFQTLRGRNKDAQGYILTGKLFCAETHRAMIGSISTSSTGKKHTYYACRKCPLKEKNCPMQSLKKDYIESAVLKNIVQMLSESSFLDLIADKIIDFNNTYELDVELIKSLSSELLDKRKRAENVMNAIMQGVVTETTKNCLQQLEDSIKLLEYQIEEEKHKKHSSISRDDILYFLKNILPDTDISDAQSQKYLINAMIKEILLYKDKIIIVYNYDKDGHKPNKDDINTIIKAIDNNDYSNNIFLPKSAFIPTTVAPKKRSFECSFFILIVEYISFLKSL